MSIKLQKNLSEMEKPISANAMQLLTKFGSDSTVSSLHIKPIHHAADRWVLTGWVDKFSCAVLINPVGKTGTNWVVYCVYPHDAAIKLAQNLALDANPINVVAEARLVDKVEAVKFAARMDVADGGTDEVTEIVALLSADVDGFACATDAPHNARADLYKLDFASVLGDRPLAASLGLISGEHLLAEPGIWTKVVTRARKRRLVDELFGAFDGIGVLEWQADSLLGFVSGTAYAYVIEKVFRTEACRPKESVDVSNDGNGTDRCKSTGEPFGGAETRATEHLGDRQAKAERRDDAELTDDVHIVGLRIAAARLSFAYFEGEAELKRGAASGDFETWRFYPRPEKRRCAKCEYNGALGLTGGVGTGNTVDLVHCAVRPATTPSSEAPTPRVVLKTYTRNLASELESQVSTLGKSAPRAGRIEHEGLYLASVDQLSCEALKLAWAEQIEQTSVALPGNAHQSVNKRSDDSRWDQELESPAAGFPDRAHNRVFLKAEYELMVLPNRSTVKAGNLRVFRSDQGVRFSRQNRTLVRYDIAVYRARPDMLDALSWVQVNHLVADLQKSRADGVDTPTSSEDAQRWVCLGDHLLADTGQDLQSGRWMYLRALVRLDWNDLFIGEDSQPKIVGTKLVVSRSGFNTVVRSWRLTHNCRVIEPDVAFGLGNLAGGSSTHRGASMELVAGYRSLRTGIPEVVPRSANLKEVDFVAAGARKWLKQCENYLTTEPGVELRSEGKGILHEGLPVTTTFKGATGTEMRTLP